jgi:methylated-DNA-[protein]-cysteine S-methyltransferase
MSVINIQTYPSPFGDLLLGSFGDALCMCDWKYRKMRVSINKRIQDGLDAHFEEAASPVMSMTIAQLGEYFSGDRTNFDVPIQLIGTDFQKSVWHALLKIPYGETETYLSLSRKLGDEKSIRAVASANGANAISIIVPCHRIIGSDGKLVGYAGGLDVKKKLLRLESNGKYPEQLELFE